MTAPKSRALRKFVRANARGIERVYGMTGVTSILESGAIEQTQPSATGVSTVKLLDLWSQSGPIFDINDPAISGDNCSYYASTIRAS